MKQWFMALACCLLMAAEALASPVQVRSFDADIEVLGNGDIVVGETLRVEIPAQGEFHGIFRDIPVVTRWKEQGRASMDVLDVRLDGRKMAADDVRREAQHVRVYQRDREKVLAPGVHEFFLSYRMTGQVGLFEKNDELTWNVTGSGWEAPVDEASCTVLCPPGAPFFAQAAWLGTPGSRQSPVSMTHEVADGRLVMRFVAQRAVQPGEEFTVAAGWQKGFVVPEKTSGAVSCTMLLALLDAAIFLYFFLVWFFTGRDPKKGVIVPLFHPPLLRSGGKDGTAGESLSPAATGYLFHKTNVTPGCFGAALISLAGRGCCIIEGQAKDGFLLRRGTGTSPHAEENRILECMEESVPVDREHGEALYDMRRAMAAQLHRDYGRMWKSGNEGILQKLFGSSWMFLGMTIAMGLLAAVLGYFTGDALPEGLGGVLMPILFLFVLGRRFVRILADLFRSGRYVPFIFALIVQTAMLAFIVFFIVSVGRGVFDALTSMEVVLTVAALLIPLCFSLIMDAPTKEARALLDGIEGLELYMRMAEGPALAALNPPDRTLEHYRELLPYAVALGLEQAWGARFSDMLSAAAASGVRELTPAVAGAFSSDADRSVSSHASSQASAASSSSSFGGDGGGGAGSGGGGGGGGGC